jgi:pyruvate/2-oxoglutarate dehydrogenase complex dihydrolipoamide acyltransferase (E2) component
MTVQLAIDHRVFDGSTAGRVPRELEKILNTEMVGELSNDKITA